MISTALIREIAENKLRENESFLVDVIISPTNKIRVTIDNFQGVSIQECVSVSRFIENQLDREAEDFELEVSSPGLDQPFKVLQQYQKYLGREVEIKFFEGKKTEGKLVAVNEKEIELEQSSKEKIEGKKGKQLVTKRLNLPFEKIKETKIIIKF
ncbi:MAG: ribosome assembly cofactor RimP [Bacteroidetes bacterium]|jgi:ribosome maturation factor RimP|nr:ribosome assembly cofactor RimP [Bacteroidota bacterium]